MLGSQKFAYGNLFKLCTLLTSYISNKPAWVALLENSHYAATSSMLCQSYPNYDSKFSIFGSSGSAVNTFYKIHILLIYPKHIGHKWNN